MSPKSPRKTKYQLTAMYAIGVIAIGAVIFRLIIHWDSTFHAISAALNVLYPFILAVFIAYFLNPLVKTLNHKVLEPLTKGKAPKFRKLTAIFLSYIIVIGLIVTILFYIIPQIAASLTQIVSFVDSAHNGYNELMEKLMILEKKNPQLNLNSLNKTMQDIPEMFIAFLTDAIPKIIPTIYTKSMSLISGIINALIAIILSVYMLIDKHHILNNCKRLIYAIFGSAKGDKILENGIECNKIFSGFIIGKLIDSLIMGILCFIAMSILKIPYTLMISVIVGITNMIPYFGPFIGAIPGVLILLFLDLKYAIIFTILIIVLQQFDGLFLGPKILGDSTGLRPMWIIFAITVGGAISGMIGMFLGVPVVAVLAYLLDRFIEKRLGQFGIFFRTNPDTGIMTRSYKALPELPKKDEN